MTKKDILQQKGLENKEKYAIFIKIETNKMKSIICYNNKTI